MSTPSNKEHNSWLTRPLTHDISFAERFVFGLLLIIVCFSVASFIRNHYVYHYKISINPNLLSAILGTCLLFYISVMIRARWKRVGYFLTAFSFTALSLLVTFLAAPALLGTPHTNILNWQLLKIDQWLGFNQVMLMNWAFQYPWLVKLLHFSYETWFFQIIFTPLVLALVKQYNMIATWLNTSLLCIIAGGLIYYFFPSFPPSSVLSSPHFAHSCSVCIKNFFLVHQGADYGSISCGLIDFPSFHVIDALINLIVFHKIKIIFIPLMILNTLLFLSTMLLGYHFLIDVIAAFVLVFIFYSLAKAVDHHSIRRSAH